MEDMIRLNGWVARFDYTDTPVPIPEAWDGSLDIDVWKSRCVRYLRIENARRNPMLKARNADGELLYVLTDSGSLRRTFPMSETLRRGVMRRDGNRCVWCESTDELEVDHIIRYIDGGGNEPKNLRTLCHRCHSSRGGR